ncbi:MarR family winged helix-turn-helix transcriptional regulator [Cohnella zeiphila]|uniref:MarR family transcriptional regulator n=1 Tax=Cohnella zeiphila TaxID=2761120 RepID=A0A7X0SSY6_9BACL|nr:MarR family transcriptional regulator [Cohnella zeiphila]MBB6735538.1 MarR family transcriptional regulator [Cohnella zeiphila]
MEDNEKVSEIFKSFREVNQAFHHAIWKRLENCGLTPIQLFVLKTLSQCPRISLSELADNIHIGSSAASGIVDRMVKMGAVMRERLESDRRSVALVLTPKGEELLEQANEISVRNLYPLLDMSDREVEDLLQLHQLIVKKITESGEGHKK